MLQILLNVLHVSGPCPGNFLTKLEFCCGFLMASASGLPAVYRRRSVEEASDRLVSQVVLSFFDIGHCFTLIESSGLRLGPANEVTRHDARSNAFESCLRNLSVKAVLISCKRFSSESSSLSLSLSSLRRIVSAGRKALLVRLSTLGHSSALSSRTRDRSTHCSSFSIKSTCVISMRRQQYLFAPTWSIASLFIDDVSDSGRRGRGSAQWLD